MINYIHGTVTIIDSDSATIESGGVGFYLNCSYKTLSRLKEGEVVRLYTHFAVAEDEMSLYGFYTTEERDLFRRLIAVSGVGKKTALSILSSLSPDEVALAVAQDNDKALAGVPGIGKKTAQRLILELKGKVTVADTTGGSKGAMQKDTIDALCSLGFDAVQAGKAVAALDADKYTRVEDMIRDALSKVTEK